MRSLLVAMLISAPAFAQSNLETRLREALRTANAQLQALQDEQAQWQAREAQYKKEIESLKVEVEAAKKSARSQASSASAASIKKEYEVKLSTVNGSLTACRQELDASEGTVRAKDEEGVGLGMALERLADQGSACEEKNRRMYAVGKSVLDWLEKMGSGAALAAREPFLQLKRVELENAAQDYRDKLLDARVGPPASH